MVEWGWTKTIAHYESFVKKKITKINTNLKNLTCVVDNKKNMCQHNKLHPLTAKKVKWISETMYKDIEKIIHQDSQKYITSEKCNTNTSIWTHVLRVG